MEACACACACAGNGVCHCLAVSEADHAVHTVVSLFKNSLISSLAFSILPLSLRREPLLGPGFLAAALKAPGLTTAAFAVEGSSSTCLPLVGLLFSLPEPLEKFSLSTLLSGSDGLNVACDGGREGAGWKREARRQLSWAWPL